MSGKIILFLIKYLLSIIYRYKNKINCKKASLRNQ